MHEVYYLPGFHTNVVSFDKLWSLGIQWDTLNCRLTWHRTTFCTLKRAASHWLMVLNDPIREYLGIYAAIKPPSNSKVPKVTSASAKLKHQRLGHAGPESIEYLKAAAEGVAISNGLKAPDTLHCDACAQAKASQVISRVPQDRAKAATPLDSPQQATSATQELEANDSPPVCTRIPQSSTS